MEVRVVMQDSADYGTFGTTAEIFINGTSADTGAIRFANGSRYLIFDTAPNTGPAQYEDFSLETLDAGTPVMGYIPIVGISELADWQILPEFLEIDSQNLSRSVEGFLCWRGTPARHAK